MCGRGAEGNLESVTGQALPATATLEMDAHAAAPRGTLCSDFGRLEFSGWAEFAAAIEEWRTRTRGDKRAENTSRRDAALR